MKNLYFVGIFCIVSIVGCTSKTKPVVSEPIKILPPDELYGDLFADIQLNEKIFPDSKTFVDCEPKFDIDTIKARYARIANKQDSASLMNYVLENFTVYDYKEHKSDEVVDINQHITNLWKTLKRPADVVKTGTLVPLKYPYIVPGGRFREVYYWDSYFTTLGLQADKEVETIGNMVDNFANLIDTVGFVPNGNRTYYLSRSQPPFFAMLVQVLAEEKGDSVYVKYLPQLLKEYDFWMKGSEKLTAPFAAEWRTVKLKDGEILNRYWDNKAMPRAEMYREDIKTAKEAVEKGFADKEETVYRHLRAGAESGWDFSSRWLTADKEGRFALSTIHTTDIIPVDLNSLLYNLEITISKAHTLSGQTDRARVYADRAESRRKAIIKYCWNEKTGIFEDYNYKQDKQTGIESLATVYPLFFHIAEQAQADKVAQAVKTKFMRPGGVVTTESHTGQQWDAPNGWAPLQWMTVAGLRNYKQTELASELKRRWLTLNQKVYGQTHKMLEKYNVEDIGLPGGGGEYPNQDGFGWTNGVYQKLAKEVVK